MTKNEFIQEAALRTLSIKFGCDNKIYAEPIAEFAKALADEVWKHLDNKAEVLGGSPAEQQVLAMVPDNEKVQTLAKEIARIERYDIEQKNAIKKNQGWNGRNFYHISGADVRFLNVCKFGCDREIDTVKDLIDFGRHNFSRLRNMGPLTMELVDKAIENLYNIKSW